MTIAFIAGTLGQGGAEKQLYYIATTLLNNGHKVHVLSNTKGEYWESILRENGVQVYNSNHSSGRINRLRVYRKILKKVQPDVIYSFHFFTNLYSAVLGKWLGAYSVGSIRNNGITARESSGKFWGYLNYRLTNTIVANSAHGLKNANKLFNKPESYGFVLNNAIDTNELTSFGSVKEPKGGERIKMLFVGRLINTKNPILFLEIAEALSKVHNVTATILGDGQLMQVLQERKRLVESERLKINFEGNVVNPMEYIANSDLLVSTSLSEGTPNVVLEAMTLNVPVVSRGYEGIHELLGENQERGFIFNSTSDAVSKIQLVIDSDQAKMLDEAKQFIDTNYSLDGLYGRLKVLFSKMGQPLDEINTEFIGEE